MTTATLDFTNYMGFKVSGPFSRVGSSGNYPGHAAWIANNALMQDNGELLVKLYNANNYEITGITGINAAGTCFDLQASAGSNYTHRGHLHCLAAHDSYRGYWFHNVAEYETVSDCWADACVFGFLVESGNNVFSNCKTRYCSVGVKIDGTNDGNNGHSVWTGLLAHHCVYPLVCVNISNGEEFVGCQFIAGQDGWNGNLGTLQFINSVGLALVGCQITTNNITVDATSQVALETTVFRGTVNVTVATGGNFTSKNPIIVPGAVLTLNGAAWNGTA